MSKYLLKDINKIFPKSDFGWIEELKKITNKIEKPWNFVGGCVRDSLLGIKTLDIDINTLALPEEIEKYMVGLNISIIGKRFGTIGVFYKQWKVEITTTREDIRTYGRHADVGFVTDFETDSYRRDFSINALMFNGVELLDYHNGIEALKNGNVLFINNAETRIKEDYLRILRYVRFLCRFDVNLNYKQYEDIIKSNLDGLKNVSMERIISEIYAMCKNLKTSEAIDILNKLGISKFLFKEDLNTKIKDTWNQNKKMMFIFINLKKTIWKNLPIVRDVKFLLELSIMKYSDLKMNFAYVWARYHDSKHAYVFLDIYNTLNSSDIYIQTDGFICDYELLNTFSNNEKSLVLILMKYFYISNIDINIENIKQHLEKIKNKIS